MKELLNAIRDLPYRLWMKRPRRWGVERTLPSGRTVTLGPTFTTRRGAARYAADTNRLVTTLGASERRAIEERPYTPVSLRGIEL